MGTDENRNEHEELNEALEAAKEEAQAAEGEAGDNETSEVEALQAQVQEFQEQMLRSQAEMQNVRRRAEIDVEKAHKFALEKFVKEQLAAELDSQRGRFDELAAELSEARARAAAELDQRVAAELAQLSMPNMQFITHLNRSNGGEPAPHGLEEIEFLVSANPGQPARPLAKVASGGELSRISLAIQVVVAQTSTTPTLVFDEVDVGIGGGTAEVVGRLLRTLGGNGQVLCVTHLPQVAAQCHQHLFVSKFTEQDATFSKIETLDDQGRISEVARMLGGVDMTEHTIAHAREMFSKGQATHH